MGNIIRKFIYTEEDEPDSITGELVIEDHVGGDTRIVVMQDGEENEITVPREVWDVIMGRRSVND